MPFVQRVVTPIYISRVSARHQQQDDAAFTTESVVNARATTSSAINDDINNKNVIKKNNGIVLNGNGISDNGGNVSGIINRSDNKKLYKNHLIKTSQSKPINDNELEAVTNLTLSNSLKQLASLVTIAHEIFNELNIELQGVCEQTNRIKLRITKLQKKVDDFDPKLVTVPESDLETFVLIKNHFKSKHSLVTSLFTVETRSDTLQRLYDGAAKTPVTTIREMDRILGKDTYDNNYDENRSSNIFLCTPILGQTRKRMRSNIDVDIETRLPAVVDCLRKWTSTEAIGDITVTPDCVSRLNFNTSTQQNNSYNTNLTQQQQEHLSELSSDEIDNITIVGNIRNDYTDDLPLDHRLPSPEEQCQIIALKFPAEVVQVDTSGRRFDRMSAARKSMLHIQIGINSPIYNNNNIINQCTNIDSDTVKRRSRSRKPRGKRRNTIAGTDQKEIEEAAHGELDTSSTAMSSSGPTGTTITKNDLDSIIGHIVPRSKSSDILKKDSILLSYNNEQSKTIPRSHFNTLKQWGKNRLKFMNRSNDDKKLDKEKVVSDIDTINVFETIVNRRKFLEKERKLSHERKPSYSSSEKSLTIMQHQTLPASINPVKLRESSSIRRQRRNGIDYKDEIHSSSGNWSASSESGRTSIGSEITTQPKSSASSNSLNHTHHLSSGPPSSIISRRRFLNTSASSSITSEGTVTPDLQVHNNDLYDDETSSSYSCDTEGYYTSFHIDSGLKTLKEEEPVTPLHTSSALSSNNSFGSCSNQTVLSAENEYELFGRGSTSTTTSSAGTVCTTLMAGGSDRNLVIGPAVPERKSSLSKLNRSNSSASGCSLERSYSSSTVGSTLERTGTIKRNGILLQKEVSSMVHQQQQQKQQQQQQTKLKDIEKEEKRIESPDSGNNTSSSPAESNTNSSPTHCLRSNSEFEYSESSDLEGVDRMERIRVKTTINTSRIPSMCVITPLNSDDESSQQIIKDKRQEQQPITKLYETDLDSLEFKNDVQITENKLITPTPPTKTTTVKNPPLPQKPNEMKKEIHHLRKARLLPLNNMLGKLRTVLPNLNKKSPNKDLLNSVTLTAVEPIYDTTSDEYVTIADVRNNNNNNNNNFNKQKKQNGVYYSNDIIKRNLATVLSGNLMNEETEYVSLNELPCNIRCESNLLSHSSNNILQTQKTTTTKYSDDEKIDKVNKEIGEKMYNKTPDETEMDEEEGILNKKGARVVLDAQGKIIYSSDSLKRRKGAHTTFSPGPCVKDPKLIILNENNNKLNDNKDIKSNINEKQLVGGVITNRKLIQVRPVIKQNQQIIKQQTQTVVDRSVKDNIIVKGKIDNNIMRMTPKTTSTGIGVRSQSPLSYKTPTTSITTSSNNTNIKGAYVNLQGKSMDGGNEMKNYTNSATPTTTTSKDYPHLYHDVVDSSMSQSYCVQSTLPRSTVAYSEYEDLEPQPFQRNNLYWTLQTRKQNNINQQGNNYHVSSMRGDDVTSKNLRIQQNIVPIEELYSTPNKNRKNDLNLKTTPLGFSTFFSPITKATELRKEYDVSPIDPRNSGTFKTSTPSKMEERVNSPSRLITEELRNKLRIHESGQRSNNSSPISSGRSTPRGILEPQNGRNKEINAQTCSDRLGTSKTTLLDFKKLLLAQAGKATTSTVSKSSAVELLKAAKSPPHSVPIIQQKISSTNNTNINILDLSGSPKTFANRRINRQLIVNPISPSKTLSQTNNTNNKQYSSSPRAGWRLQNTRSDIMSIAIPEVNSEEDISPSNSINPGSSTSSLSPIKESTVVEEKLNIRDNIFLKTEENNFMKHELNQKLQAGYSTTTGISRSQYLQAQRAQFLMGNNIKQNNTTINSTQFKNGHYTGMTNTNNYSHIPFSPSLASTSSSSSSSSPPPFNINTSGDNSDILPVTELGTAQSLETAL